MSCSERSHRREERCISKSKTKRRPVPRGHGNRICGFLISAILSINGDGNSRTGIQNSHLASGRLHECASLTEQLSYCSPSTSDPRPIATHLVLKRATQFLPGGCLASCNPSG